MEINTYDIIYSLQRFFENKLGIQADWVYDGYEYPGDKPFMTLETIQDNYEIVSKGREAVQVERHLQIGYHASNIVDRTKRQDEIARLLQFSEVPYFNTGVSVDTSVGYFLCELTAVVPMPSGDITSPSEHNRVYFDVEIENIIRRC